MRKLLIVFSTVVLLLTVTIIYISKYKKMPTEENTYCVETTYSYLSKESINFDVKLYSNYNDSLLKYSNEANVYLHDKAKDKIISLKVVEVNTTDTTTYNDEKYYEYTLSFLLDIDRLVINECYLTLEFTNKTYNFKIGSFEVVKNIYEENILKITNLYGVRKENDLNTHAIIITLTNPCDYKVIIKKIFISSKNNVVINNDNKVELKESQVLEDYIKNLNLNSQYLSLNPGETITILLPIINNNLSFLSNFYLLFETDESTYYFPNFTYITTNDIDSLKKYINKGKIYEF